MTSVGSFFSGLIGGFIFSLGLLLYYLLKGRLIAFATLSEEGNQKYRDNSWFFMCIGMVAIWGLMVGNGSRNNSYNGLYLYKDSTFDNDTIFAYICGSFFIGMGSKFQGCTNALGSSGVLRPNKRSVVSFVTSTFIAFAITNLRQFNPYLIGFPVENLEKSEYFVYNSIVILFISVLTILTSLAKMNYHQGFVYTLGEFFSALACTFLISAGYIVSGLTLKDKVRNFYIMDTEYDFGYGAFLIAVFVMNTFGYHYIDKLRAKPILEEEFNMEADTRIDVGLVTGSALFGVGFGIIGMCPGPIYLNLYHYIYGWVYFIFYYMGYLVVQILQQQMKLFVEIEMEYAEAKAKEIKNVGLEM